MDQSAHEVHAGECYVPVKIHPFKLAIFNKTKNVDLYMVHSFHPLISLPDTTTGSLYSFGIRGRITSSKIFWKFYNSNILGRIRRLS